MRIKVGFPTAGTQLDRHVRCVACKVGGSPYRTVVGGATKFKTTYRQRRPSQCSGPCVIPIELATGGPTVIVLGTCGGKDPRRPKQSTVGEASRRVGSRT